MSAEAVAQLQTSINRLTQMMGALSDKTTTLEERIATIPQALPAAAGVVNRENTVVPMDKRLKVATWEAGMLRTPIQRKIFLEELTEHFGRRMVDGAEPTRDYYELKSLLEGLGFDLQLWTESVRDDAAKPEGVRLQKFKHVMKRALLLKEKTENGVESMKALERRLEDLGYDAEFEGALKEVRARQLQAALQRQGSRVDHDSTLPRTQPKPR